MSVALTSRPDDVPGDAAPQPRGAGASVPTQGSAALDPRRHHRSHRAGLGVLGLLTIVVSAAALGCSKTDQVAATGPTTSGATATTTIRLSGDAGGGRSSGPMAPATAGITTAPPSSAGAPTTAPAASPSSSASTLTTQAGIAPTTRASSGAASIEAFCARNAQTNTDFQNMDPSHDFANYLAKVRQVTTELAALAPADIKADVQAIADAFARITTTEQMDSMSGDPAVKAASDRVSDWTRVHCPTP